MKLEIRNNKLKKKSSIACNFTRKRKREKRKKEKKRKKRRNKSSYFVCFT